MTESATHHAAHGAPEQQAGGPPKEPLGEQAHPTDDHDHEHGHDNSPEAIQKEIRRYLLVFGALAALTVITVAIAQFHLPTWQAVTLALLVATVKGTLVAAFFMHLVSERKLIYAVLLMTVFFFGLMIWGPSHHHSNAEKSWPGYDLSAKQPPPASTDTASTDTSHGAGH